MMEADEGDLPSRFDVVCTGHGRYELWIADRIAVFDDQADIQRYVELLVMQAGSIGLGRRH